MFKISKFSVPRTLIEAVRQAASKSGGKGSGDKGKASVPPKKSSACGPKKDAKGTKQEAKKDAEKAGKIEKCGGAPPTAPPSAGDGKPPPGSLGGVGRESSCKAKVKQPAKGASAAGTLKKICLFGIVPALILLNILVFSSRSHEEREEFKKWPHLYKRDKPFPWRDGVKSLFHNSHTNALPETGYEDE